MKKIHFVNFAAIMVLGACSHYSDELSSLDKEMTTPAKPVAVAFNPANPQEIAPAAGGVNENFSKYLAREYYDMAKYENEKAYDYKSARNYTGKALTASKGQLVVPSKVSAYDIPSEKVGELNTARGQLISALKEQNTPENALALAKAQGKYECWLERAEEAADETHYAACKSEFEGAMASLMTPAAGAATIYDIGFAGNSALIEPANETTVALIAQFLNDPKNAAYEASLIGFGSAAAQGEYATQLTTSRIAAVRDGLVAKGVAIERLKTLISPSVAAAEGKVEVTLLAPQSIGVYGTTTKTEFVPATQVPAPLTTAPQIITPSTNIKTN